MVFAYKNVIEHEWGIPCYDWKSGWGKMQLLWSPWAQLIKNPPAMQEFSSVQSLSRVWLFATPWTASCQASLSVTNSRSHPNPCPLSRWCHPTISSSVVPLSSCPQSLPASGSSYVYKKLNHLAMHLKLSQHCKPTVFQLLCTYWTCQHHQSSCYVAPVTLGQRGSNYFYTQCS